MGRRSINTTKSGKYMNPTDQARKEARKKELKKNKKQRQMVRAAVLKGKDPQQLIVDLEKIDQMEYNVLQPSPLNEKVLKDKRKKLKDTLDRVLKMYNKDDPDKWSELKRVQVEYERKRSTLFNYYEAVKNAQQVQIDEIPLPINSLPPELQAAFVGMPSQIPLPPHILRADFPPPQSILKKSSSYITKESKKEPPGVPPGPPPDLEEYDVISEEAMEVFNPILKANNVTQKKSIRFADEPEKELGLTEQEVSSQEKSDENKEEEQMDEEAETAVAIEKDEDLRPTSLQQRMLAMAGQNIDEFMKEMEQVNKKRRADRAADLDTRLQALDNEHGEMSVKSLFSTPPESIPSLMNTQPETISVPGLGPPPQHTLGVLPGMPPMMFRPPPRGVPSLMGIRLPPGPPPGLPPRMGIRLPPGPPPGLPPRMIRPPNIPVVLPPTAQANVLSAAPQLIHRPEPGPTIQAQAQIRNLSADVTRFLPTALRVRRDEKHKPKPKAISMHEPKVEIHHAPPVLKPGQTKDDAYQQFMREMEGLM